jgi:putative methyltransferase
MIKLTQPKSLYLFQPQYSVEYRNEKNYWIPYSVGCLWSYCDQFEDIQTHIQLQDIVFKREIHEEYLSTMRSPDVCGFSCYQWNKNYNLTLAKKIKERWPNCLIVFGGPETNTAFLNYDYVDTIISGEGEHALVEILRLIIANEPVPAVYQKQRIKDLNLPSPYTSGVFDNLIRNNPEVKWATTLETNRGCPYACTFCDWGSLTYSKVNRFSLARVAEDLNWISQNPITYLFCADANFGIFKDRDRQIAQMVKATADKNPNLEVFNATFNKNNNEHSFEILKILGELNRGFSVSVQSLNPATLSAIKRDNLRINDLKHIFELCQRYDIKSYSDLILGLPLETRETFVKGICDLLEFGQHNSIEIWFTDMLSNSELNNLLNRHNYKIRTVMTQDYLTLSNDDIDLYPETVELVNQTSTMSTEEMIDSFLYGWLVVNFHLQGYSQLASQFCRHKYNISFYEFYDQLKNCIVTNNVLYSIYIQVRNNLCDLLYRGTLPVGTSAHNLIFSEALQLYKNKEEIFLVIAELLQQLTGKDCSDIMQLQQSFIYDNNCAYPCEVSTTFNFTTMQSEPTMYRINSRVSWTNIGDFDKTYYALRKKGVLKNSMDLL